MKSGSNRYIKIIFLLYIFILLTVSFLGIGVLPFLWQFGTRMDVGYSSVSHNITPFKSILDYLLNFEHYNLRTWLYNTFGNVLMFVPLGTFIPFVIAKLRFLRQIIYISIVVSLFIETVQFIFELGVFDVDDLILNTLGSIVGFSFYRLIYKIEH